MRNSQHQTHPRATETRRHGTVFFSVAPCLRPSTGAQGVPSIAEGRAPWLSLAFAIVYFAFRIDVASATVLLPADFATIVTGSPVIVHGRVVEVRSLITGPRRTIESVVTLSVIDTLRGDPARTILFRVPNGQVGRYRRIVVGAPEFEEGDEVVVFLEARAPAIPTLFGLSQGVYRVVRDANAQALVTPPPVMARGIGAVRVVRGDPVRQPMPIGAFAREVRAVLERAR